MSTNKKKQRYRLRPGILAKLFRRFKHHLKPYRRTLTSAGLCMLGATAMEIARPWPLKIIFDGLLIPQETPDPITASALQLTGGGSMLLAVTSGAVLLFAVLGGLFGFGQSYLIASVGQKVVASVRLQLYSHIQRLSHSFHDEWRSGDLFARLTGDVRMMRDLLVNSIIYVSARVLVVIGTLLVMSAMDWQLTLVAVLVLPVLILATRKFGGKIKGAARRQRRKESKIADVMTENISLITVVQAYAREAYAEERFAKQNNSSAKAGLVATRLEAHLDRLVQVILALGTSAVIWFGVIRIQAGALSPGDLLVFTAYLTMLYKPVRKLAALTGRIAKASVCGERILQILDLQSDIQEKPDAVTAGRFTGSISFRGVTFSYARGKPVLSNVSFDIASGQTVALVGPSGAGKSTIGNLLLRFYDPQSGAVYIDGEDVRNLTLTSLRDQISIVLQDTALFATTIRENIAYGRLDATDAEIVAAARSAQAHDFIEGLPDGYETLVGERGATLSGGQRQRIAIARSIVRDSPIIILDEPTAGLDQDSEAAVRRALSALTQSRTCILITHDVTALAAVDRVFRLHNGHLDETPPEAMARTASHARTAGM